jgi:hypothetical protein
LRLSSLYRLELHVPLNGAKVLANAVIIPYYRMNSFHTRL